jgi:hypothetical protein
MWVSGSLGKKHINMEYSDYIVYVDESGDHGLVNIDKQYPIFVLAFCIFKKSDYLKTVQDFQEFKFNHFGHDIVILHENEIRKDKGVFKVLNNLEKKSSFIKKLSDVVNQQKFAVISTTIKKDELKERYRYDNNPYHIALKFCIERLFNFLIASNFCLFVWVSDNSIQLVALSNQLIVTLWNYFVCSPLSSQNWLLFRNP